jgi:hypothetical protein
MHMIRKDKSAGWRNADVLGQCRSSGRNLLTDTDAELLGADRPIRVQP